MKARIVLVFTFLLIGLLFIEPATPVQSQTKKGPRFGKDSVTCITNISLYREFYRQWKSSRYKSETVNDAIKPWRWVFVNCPRGTQYTYPDGQRMMKYYIENAETPELREKYIDSLMLVHDQRIEYYGNKGPNLGRKAVDFYQYRTAEFEEAYNMFRESISITKNKSQGPIVIYYFRLTAKMVKEEVAEPSLIVETYDEVSDIIDYNLTKYQNKQSKLEAWLNVKGNIEAEFEPFATCEDLVSIYSKKFEKNPEDLELLKKITSILEKKDCTEEQLFMDATIQLYKLEPSPESAYLIARMYLKQNNYKDALTYLTEAAGMENTEKLADVHYFMAICNYQVKRYSVARSNAKKALEYNPNYGNAYLLIGDMYAASAKNCGGDDLTNKVAFWAAVDKYYQAKRIDPSIADVANRRIRDYKKHFPTMETIFFYNLKEGDTYKVGCWINETTTVRAAPQ